jgi:hypothetical protein
MNAWILLRRWTKKRGGPKGRPSHNSTERRRTYFFFFFALHFWLEDALSVSPL